MAEKLKVELKLKVFGSNSVRLIFFVLYPHSFDYITVLVTKKKIYKLFAKLVVRHPKTCSGSTLRFLHRNTAASSFSPVAPKQKYWLLPQATGLNWIHFLSLEQG